MIPLPPISTRTYTLFPYTTLFRALGRMGRDGIGGKPLGHFPDGALVVGKAELHGVISAHRRNNESIFSGRGPIGPALGDRLHLGEELHAFHARSEEHTSELQSLMRISYAVFCLKKKTHHNKQ